MRYHYVPFGLAVEGRGRALVSHSAVAGFNGWGAGGLVRFAPGADGSGLAFSLQPAWGDADGSIQPVWDTEVSNLSVANAAAAQVSAEIGYGFLVGAESVLTPFGGLKLAPNGSQVYLIGGRFGDG